jgi:hypothetical protein
VNTIGKTELFSYFDAQTRPKRATNTDIRRGAGHRVRNYLELATKVAELQFLNQDHVFLFRGQGNDHHNRNNNTTLKPSLMRSIHPARNLTPPQTAHRFEILRLAEMELERRFVAAELLGVARLQRHRIMRWSILQHYEICRTPLLDVTHSLRVAASFASADSQETAFLFVLGVPNLSGGITASSESGLQIVRLASVCPPSALRPHIQEGYLLGVYPDMGDPEQKQHYEHYEIDFGRRLIAKFCFNPKRFWKANDAFPAIARAALYPDAADPLYRLATKIRAYILKSEH